MILRPYGRASESAELGFELDRLDVRNPGILA